MKGLGRNTRFKKTQKRTGGMVDGPARGTFTAKVPPKKKRGYGQASDGKTGKAGGGQTKFQKAYSKLTPKQKQSDAMKMYLANRPRKKPSGRPSLAKNTGEPTNVRKKRPGGMATGGRTKKAGGGQTMSQKIFAKMTPKQQNNPLITEWLKGRKKASGRPSLARNTGEPTNVRKKRPGGFATGGKVQPARTQSGSSRRLAIRETNPPKPKPKKQRGYGKASEGKTGYRNKGATEIGKEQKVQSYKEYVKKAFGGGFIK